MTLLRRRNPCTHQLTTQTPRPHPRPNAVGILQRETMEAVCSTSTSSDSYPGTSQKNCLEWHFLIFNVHRKHLGSCQEADSDLVGLGQGPRIYTSLLLPGKTDAVGHFEQPRFRLEKLESDGVVKILVKQFLTVQSKRLEKRQCPWLLVAHEVFIFPDEAVRQRIFSKWGLKSSLRMLRSFY